MHSDTWESDAVETFHFRAQEAFCTYRQEKQGGKRRGRKERGERLIGHASHTKKKRKSTLFLPHKLDRYCECTWRLRKKYSLPPPSPPEGEKKVKTLLLLAALDVFSLALQAPPPLPSPSNQKSLTRPLGKRRERRVCACVYTAAPGEKEFSKPEAEGGRRVFFSFSSSSSSSS